jgi:hypothetical protein
MGLLVRNLPPVHDFGLRSSTPGPRTPWCCAGQLTAPHRWPTRKSYRA